MSRLLQTIESSNGLWVRQRHEAAELFGFETRNKYELLDETEQAIGFAAEQRRGYLGAIFRQILGHWRKFDIHFFDMERAPVLHAHHPFRWFFQRLNVVRPNGEVVGALQQRFSLINKKFDVLGPRGQHLMTMKSPIWRIWTFRFLIRENEAARVEKKWSGLLSEAFTDKDNFKITVKARHLGQEERLLLLAAAVFIDLIYFEKKAGSD